MSLYRRQNWDLWSCSVVKFLYCFRALLVRSIDRYIIEGILQSFFKLFLWSFRAKFCVFVYKLQQRNQVFLGNPKKIVPSLASIYCPRKLFSEITDTYHIWRKERDIFLGWKKILFGKAFRDYCCEAEDVVVVAVPYVNDFCLIRFLLWRKLLCDFYQSRRRCLRLWQFVWWISAINWMAIVSSKCIFNEITF